MLRMDARALEALLPFLTLVSLSCLLSPGSGFLV